MSLQNGRLVFPSVVLVASLLLFPANGRAQLLPPGDLNGKTFQQWGVDWSIWSAPLTAPDFIVPDPSRQDTVNGVRYLPVGPPTIQHFTANLAIEPGIALFGSPFSFFGERYDDGHADDPADPIIPQILDGATVRATLDGVALLDGTASSLSARGFGPSFFTEPIPYTTPQQRGPDGSPSGEGLFAVASAWTYGIGTMFANLSPGEHTLLFEYNSEFFGGAFSSTYHITVVPEPGSLIPAGLGILGLVGCARWRIRGL